MDIIPVFGTEGGLRGPPLGINFNPGLKFPAHLTRGLQRVGTWAFYGGSNFSLFFPEPFFFGEVGLFPIIGGPHFLLPRGYPL